MKKRLKKRFFFGNPFILKGQYAIITMYPYLATGCFFREAPLFGKPFPPTDFGRSPGSRGGILKGIGQDEREGFSGEKFGEVPSPEHGEPRTEKREQRTGVLKKRAPENQKTGGKTVREVQP